MQRWVIISDANLLVFIGNVSYHQTIQKQNNSDDELVCESNIYVALNMYFNQIS